MGREHDRLAFALLLSLLIHTLLLSLIFGGEGLGLPGFGFPWRDRRIEAPELQITLVPTHVTPREPAIASVAAPLQQPWVEQPAANAPTLTPSVSHAPSVVRLAAAGVSETNPKAEANPTTGAATGAPAAKAPLPHRSPKTAPPPSPAPAVIALERTDEDTWVVPAPPAIPMPLITTAPSASIPETPMPSLPDAGDVAQPRVDQEPSERAVELPKLEPFTQGQRQAEQLEAALQEAARQAAAVQEAARQVAARQEAALQGAARQEAERQEAARRAAAEQEAQGQELARQEAARQEAELQEAARQEAELQEAARQEAELQEAARLAAAQQQAQRQEVARQEEAARVEAARQEAERQEAARVRADEEAKREARLRAIGRQLDEEAAQREELSNAARLRSTLPPSWSTARRVRLWGRADPNAELIRYAEAWERKIQLNTPVDTVREVAKQLRTNPIVTVAIRSDGSVESVTFVVSSGLAEVDEAIRRIVQGHGNYQAFPPALASEYDVIEIRRTWHFDEAIRFY